MISLKSFLKRKNSKFIFFKFILKLSILLPIIIFLTFLCLPIRAFLKNKNTILIVRNKFQVNGKNKLIYPIESTLKSYYKKKNLSINVINFFTDDYYTILKYYFFIKCLILNVPSYVFFFSDYDVKNKDINFVFQIFTKYIFKSKLIGISNDGIWGVNYLRNKFINFIYDGLICWPWAYLINKKIKAPLTVIVPNKNINNKINRKNISVVFIGRDFGNRKKFIQFIEKNEIKVNKYGVAYSKVLSKKKYYNVLHNSKISLNFSKNEIGSNALKKFHIRARLFESIANGCLVFDEYNNDTELFFKKNFEYVAFSDKKDLVKKLKFHIKNYKNIGSKIALRALNRLKKEHSSFNFWEKFFKII